MSLPHFDPWSTKTSLRGRAYRAYSAYSAYPEAKLGTLGTIGTGIETISCDARVQKWVAQLIAAHARPLSADITETIEATIAFCRGPWINRLCALGWTEHELFGMTCEGTGAGGLVQSLKSGRIRFATVDAVYFESGSHWSAFAHQRPGLFALPRIWELPIERASA